MRIDVVGISDNHNPTLTPEVFSLIQSAKLFSGGVRHYEIIKPYLPSEASWINITVPLSEVFKQYQGKEHIVVFASGDPLFFGFANTIQRELPTATLTVFPSFNSLQMLAHRLLLPYHNMHVVSLTGRPWKGLDEALINGEALIGILTDRHEHTPYSISERMLRYGYDNYTMSVGVCLGNANEMIWKELSLTEVLKQTFSTPNCIILTKQIKKNRLFGIPERAFALLDGRANMITKMPIRLLSLSLLNLRSCQTFWDVGFCTGSVSVEAKLQFPHLDIIAFEKRTSGKDLLEANSIRFGAIGIRGVIGDFLKEELSAYPSPDAVFLGGYGGEMQKMVDRITAYLNPGGCIVFNSVSEKSYLAFHIAAQSNGLEMTDVIPIKVASHNEITVMKAVKKMADRTYEE